MDIAVLGIKSIPAVAGADRVVEKLLENYSGDHDYWVYIRKDTPDGARCHGNLHFIHVPAPRGKHLGSFVYFFLCCLHYLTKGRYDLAHVHNSDFGLFVPLLKLKRGVPVLGTFHGDPYTRAKWGLFARSYLRLSERFFVQFCDRLSSVSRFKERGEGLWSRREIEYVPNGVDPYWRIEDPEAFDFARHGLVPGGYALFACGRLDPTKGLHHLLEAWAGLESDLKLLVVGDFSHDRHYSEEMDRRIEALSGVVAHRNLLPRQALLEVLRKARVFVFPSEYEAMSMMLLEAISCKTPVVCSDIPENRAVLVEDYPFLHANRDASSLREALMRWTADPDPEAWTERLFARCMEEFDWRRITGEYERFYRELSASTPSPAGVAARMGGKES